MWRRWLLAALVLATAGCGSSHQSPGTTVASPPVAPPAQGRLAVRLTAPTHTPRVNAKWRYAVRVTANGKPVAARIHLQVLFLGAAVGNIGTHVVRNGVWAETITWPAASRGHPLVFRAQAASKGRTGTALYPVKVR